MTNSSLEGGGAESACDRRLQSYTGSIRASKRGLGLFPDAGSACLYISNFRLSKMVRLRSASGGALHPPWPFDFLAVSALWLFGGRGATIFLGVSEWIFAALLFLGFWNPRLGALGSAGAVLTFIATVTIIPFFPNGWAAAAGGFPAMTLPMAFLMKDVGLLVASFYLLRQDVARLTASSTATMRPAQVTAADSS